MKLYAVIAFNKHGVLGVSHLTKNKDSLAETEKEAHNTLKILPEYKVEIKEFEYNEDEQSNPTSGN